ncbi:MAG: aspartate aminotransferase family protein [Spirochaetes bacterium]|nr:MAG: aspartate aminotransferase family protein [Spirochaetota bacterium]
MIQEKLFRDLENDDTFDRANVYGRQYLKDVFSRAIFPEKNAIKNLSVFEEELTEKFTSSEEILELLNNYGSPATVAQFGGRYFGFVNGSMIPAGLAARLLADFWDQNAAMQVTSPIISKLEEVVQSWLVDLFNLPENTVAGFVSGTSMATFSGLAAARFRILGSKGWDVNKKGLFQAPQVRIVLSRQAHSTVLKAIGLLGFGTDCIEWVNADSQGRIIPEDLPELDENTILILQAGNVNTGSFDELESICRQAKESNTWVHIDGAFGLWAAASDKLKYLVKGMELADSWSVDGHKTLNTPYDNGIILCRDEEALVSALQMSGSYIIAGKDRDGMNYTPEMSRRSRVVELWATCKSLGNNGINDMVFNMHMLAKQFAEGLKKEGFTILNEICFNQVLIRCKDNNHTDKLLQKVQELNVLWCGSSEWNGEKAIRISICSWASTPDDIKMSLDSFVRAKKLI